MKKTTRFAGGFLHITNSCNLGSGVAAVRGDLYKGKETFPHCQSLALRERWHFACEMTERVRHERCRGFLVGAGVSASRAAKKAPPGLFSRRNASAGPQLFESTREGVTLVFCKRKRPAYFLRWSFWWARVSRRAALLKKPHWGFFARRDASAGPQLFESTREGVTLGFLQKKKTGVFSTLVFLVGAGVSASRAAKKAPLGLFCPAGRKRRAAAVRIHPRGCDFVFLQKKKTNVFSTLVFLVGAGGFEQAALSPVGSCLNAIQRIHAAFQSAA